MLRVRVGLIVAVAQQHVPTIEFVHTSGEYLSASCSSILGNVNGLEIPVKSPPRRGKGHQALGWV